MRAALTLLALLLSGSNCEEPEFQFDGFPCPDVTGRADNDDLPPWPPSEDTAPAPGGPTLEEGSFEFLGRAEGCRDFAALTIVGRDAENDVTEESVRGSLFVWSVGMDTLDAIEIVELTGFTALGEGRFEATANACVNQITDHGPGVRIHIVDDAGNGSNAICARTFARSGVDLPPNEGSP
jgi:hypothetical protein